MVRSHNIRVIGSELSQDSSDWDRLVTAGDVFMRYRDILPHRVHRQSTLVWLKFYIRSLLQRTTTHSEGSSTFTKGNRLLSLDPYFDVDWLLHVGDRLKQSSLYAADKHPIILSTHHIHVYLSDMLTSACTTVSLFVFNGTDSFRDVLNFTSQSHVKPKISIWLTCAHHRA